MKTLVLKQAIESAQMLKLLWLLEYQNKLSRGRVVHLRSALEMLVNGAHANSQPGVPAILVKSAENLTQGLHEALSKMLSVNIKLDDVLTQYNKSGLSVFEMSRLRTWRVDADSNSLVQAHTPFGLWLSSAQAWVTKFRSQVPDRAEKQAVKTFSSLVRNAPWCSLLMELKAEELLVLKTANRLREEFASRQGMELFASRFQALCSDGDEHSAILSSVPSGGLRFVVHVRVSSLLTHPEVAPLLDKRQQAAAVLSPDQTDEALLTRCAIAHEVTTGQELQEWGQKTLGLVCETLKARNAELTKVQAQRKRRQTLEDKKKAKEALSKLDPKLLKVLKDHPDLLSEV